METERTHVNTNEPNALHTEYDISALFLAPGVREPLEHIQAHNVNAKVPLTRAQYHQTEWYAGRVARVCEGH